MASNDSRPVNLDLVNFDLPITAKASILHRVCAVISWVGIGFALYALCILTNEADGATKLNELFASNFLVQFIAWGLLSAFGYYCCGSLKHIIQDFGFFEDFEGGKLISWAAIIAGVILSIASGVLIWA